VAAKDSDMNRPKQQQWRELYKAAIAVRELAPWEWMLEADVFGVQEPETGEIGFVSVMGSLGEHLSIAVYMGAQNIHDFWYILHTRDDTAGPQRLLELYHLQASFEDREFLQPNDQRVIKSLKYKFRGPHAYPLFRAYHPAKLAWYISAEEARLLIVVLEQLLEVAPRYKSTPDPFGDYDAEHFLVRVKTEEGWQDQDMYIPQPLRRSIAVQLDQPLLATYQAIPQSRGYLDIDLFMVMKPVTDAKSDRPFYPYALLILDPQQDFIIAMDLQEPLPDLDSMYAQVPMAIVHQLAGVGVRPRSIRVTSPLLYGLLKPHEKALGFGVQHKSHLPMLEQAKASFERFPGL